MSFRVASIDCAHEFFGAQTSRREIGTRRIAHHRNNQVSLLFTTTQVPTCPQSRPHLGVFSRDPVFKARFPRSTTSRKAWALEENPSWRLVMMKRRSPKARERIPGSCACGKAVEGITLWLKQIIQYLLGIIKGIRSARTLAGPPRGIRGHSVCGALILRRLGDRVLAGVSTDRGDVGFAPRIPSYEGVGLCCGILDWNH